MALTCPNCGSRHLRPSRYQNSQERVNAFRFISPLRCQDCKTRFVSRTVFFEDLFYARCPRCDRMDLNDWSPKSNTPSAWTAFKIVMGARRWRCEYCRINFASFRGRKEVFSFKRWSRRNPDRVAESGAAKPVDKPAIVVTSKHMSQAAGMEIHSQASAPDPGVEKETSRPPERRPILITPLDMSRAAGMEIPTGDPEAPAETKSE